MYFLNIFLPPTYFGLFTIPFLDVLPFNLDHYNAKIWKIFSYNCCKYYINIKWDQSVFFAHKASLSCSQGTCFMYLRWKSLFTYERQQLTTYYNNNIHPEVDVSLYFTLLSVFPLKCLGSTLLTLLFNGKLFCIILQHTMFPLKSLIRQHIEAVVWVEWNPPPMVIKKPFCQSQQTT